MSPDKKRQMIEELTRGLEDLAFTRLRRLFSREKDEFEEFIIEDGFHIEPELDYTKIVGTQHPDYAENSWLDLFRYGKRMHINLPLFMENPEYYIEEGMKIPVMSFMKEEDGYYVYHDGNHRSCIANFFLRKRGIDRFGQVEVHEKKRDKDLQTIYYEILDEVKAKKKNIHVHIHKEHIGREDGAGWKKDLFQISFKIWNVRTGMEGFIQAEEAEDYLNKLKNPGRFSWLKRSGEFYGLV